jgi:arylsulfatase A-like enzyme
MKILRLLACVFATILLVSPLARAEARRPNFVFIITDDQRWDALSCMGHPFLKTPNIDRIGNEGAIFQNFFVTTPLCSPSRSSFLTGQYVHTTRVYGNGDSSEVSHRLITWPALLQKTGYETAFIGKLHMGSDSTPRPGFDRWISFKGQGVYIDPLLNIDGKESRAEGYVTDILSDHTVDFIKKDHAGKPFAVLLLHKAVHQPCVPAERHKDLYKNDTLPRYPAEDDDLSGKPVLRGMKDKEGTSDKQIRNMYRCIQSVDDGVGKVLAALEETKQLDNTIIIFTSDNGYFFGEHHLSDKRAAYEESIRDPLLVRYPPMIKAGSKPAGIALNIDIASTTLELAGADVPANIHGKSLVPILKDSSAKLRDSALLEYFMEPRYPHIPTWQSVRGERWKYIHYTDVADSDELYDLQNDPHEMKNVIGNASAKQQLDDLKAQLAHQLEQTK